MLQRACALFRQLSRLLLSFPEKQRVVSDASAFDGANGRAPCPTAPRSSGMTR